MDKKVGLNENLKKMIADKELRLNQLREQLDKANDGNMVHFQIVAASHIARIGQELLALKELEENLNDDEV